jgi:hypothetical protein
LVPPPPPPAAGESQLGLLHECHESLFEGQRRERCGEPVDGQPTWAAAAALLIIGLFFVAAAIFLVLRSLVSSRYLKWSQWTALTAGECRKEMPGKAC